MAPLPSSDDAEQESLRVRLRFDTLRLIMGGAAVPLPLITLVNSERFLPILDLLGIPLSALMPYGFIATGAAASVFGWMMILPLLSRHEGWRAQVACLIAVALSIQTAMVLTALVAVLSRL